MKMIRVLIVLASLVLCTYLPACTRTDQESVTLPEKVTIANIGPPFTVLMDVAQAQDYFKEEGLSVDMQKYPYGKIALQALLDGKADFATVAETPFMFQVMKGEKLSVIAAIMTSNRNSALVARKDRGIHTPDDLKGRKIAATFGTISEFFMDAFLALNGISRKDAKVVNLTPDQMLSALSNGDVDAVSTWVPPLLEIQRKLGERGITFHNEEIHRQTMIVVAKQDYISSHPGTVKKMLHALIKAEEFVKQDPAEVQQIIAGFDKIDAGMLRDMVGGNTYEVSLDQQLVLSLEDESRWAIRGGLTSGTDVPNYLDFIYLDGMLSVKPKAVTILR